MLWPWVFTTILIAILTLLLLRLRRLPPFLKTPLLRNTPTHLLVVLGSGGHTAEMLSMLHGLKPHRYPHRTYILSSGDAMSAVRATDFEAKLATTIAAQSSRTANGDTENNANNDNQSLPATQDHDESWCIHTVPRARVIHQSLLTTPISSTRCLLACLHLLQHHPRGWGYPDLILVNGPATSLILLLASILLRGTARVFDVLGLGFRPADDDGDDGARSRTIKQTKKQKTGRKEATRRRGEMRTIYIESWARVKTPSLSLRIIAWGRLSGRVIVQWEALARAGWGEFRGDLMR